MNVSRKKLDLLNAQISKQRAFRKKIIKSYEKDLIMHIEKEIIVLLERHKFNVTDHQLNRWIVAVRGNSLIKIWLLLDEKPKFGLFTIKIVINDYKLLMYVLVNHKFSNVEYNYLCIDYEQELLRKISELTKQLNELKELKEDDINGNYVACTDSKETGEKTKLTPFSEFFENILLTSDGRE